MEQWEKMGAFFDVRAGMYEDHMRAFPGVDSYGVGASFAPQTQAPVRLLDLGCGTGLEMSYLFGRMPNLRATCLDLSGEMLSVLRAHYAGRAAQLTLLQASYLDWDYPEAAFDLAVSFNSLHHLEEAPKQALYRRIRDSLVPGGRYIETDFMAPAGPAQEYRARYEAACAALGEAVRQGAYHIDLPMTPDSQRGLMLGAGFDEVNVVFSDLKAEGSFAVLVARR